MKFDKETVIVILIAAVLIGVWFYFYPKYQREKAEENARIEQEIAARTTAQNAAQTAPAQSSQLPVAPAATSAQPAETDVVTPDQEKAAPAVASESKKIEPQIVTLSNSQMEVFLNVATGGIQSAVLKNFRNAKNHDEVVSGLSGAPYESLFPQIPDTELIAANIQDGSKTDTGVIFDLQYSNGLCLTETVNLPADGYLIKVNYTFTNKSDKALNLNGITFWAAGLPPTKYFSGDKIYSERHNIDYLGRSDSVVTLDPAAKEEKFKEYGTGESVRWVGSTNKYFLSLLSTESANTGMCVARNYHADPNAPKEQYVIPAAGIRANLTLAAGQSSAMNFDYYFGPKEISQISKLDPTVMDAMHFSYWSWFEFLARPMIRFLLWLNSYVHSYGVSIILLTLIVRFIFWPITQKANNSMRKMQKLKPRMDEIRTKYKDNAQEMNQRIMELYRTEKVSPLGGCLPLLLQIPIFFALYSALDSAVELRQVPFLWCTDLAKPDLIGPQITLPLLGEVGLHPLVIIMTILMVVQQKMSPSNMEPAQQKMMLIMPIIMLFMLYNLPSGLTLYWAVSNAFSILQMKYGMIIAKREEAKEAAAASKQ